MTGLLCVGAVIAWLLLSGAVCIAVTMAASRYDRIVEQAGIARRS